MLDVKENADVLLELWTENPDQEEGWNLWPVILFTVMLNRMVTREHDSGYIFLYLFKGALKGVRQWITVSEKFKQKHLWNSEWREYKLKG